MRRWAIVLVGLLFAGCAFDTEPCASDEDCPDGTTCRIAGGADSPFCVATIHSDSGVEQGDDGDRDETRDQGKPDDPDTMPDGTNEGDAPPMCEPVADCGADEPNEGRNAVALTSYPVGCPNFDLEMWDSTRSDVACARDVDEYIIEFVRCENQTYKLTATLTPVDVCDQGVDLQIVDGPLRCSDSEVRCEEVDGRHRITMLIRADDDYGRPVEEAVLRVRGHENGGRYRLRTTVSQ